MILPYPTIIYRVCYTYAESKGFSNIRQSHINENNQLKGNTELEDGAETVYDSIDSSYLSSAVDPSVLRHFYLSALCLKEMKKWEECLLFMESFMEGKGRSGLRVAINPMPSVRKAGLQQVTMESCVPGAVRMLASKHLQTCHHNSNNGYTQSTHNIAPTPVRPSGSSHPYPVSPAPNSSTPAFSHERHMVNRLPRALHMQDSPLSALQDTMATGKLYSDFDRVSNLAQGMKNRPGRIAQISSGAAFAGADADTENAGGQETIMGGNKEFQDGMEGSEEANPTYLGGPQSNSETNPRHVMDPPTNKIDQAKVQELSGTSRPVQSLPLDLTSHKHNPPPSTWTTVYAMALQQSETGVAAYLASKVTNNCIDNNPHQVQEEQRDDRIIDNSLERALASEMTCTNFGSKVVLNSGDAVKQTLVYLTRIQAKYCSFLDANISNLSISPADRKNMPLRLQHHPLSDGTDVNIVASLCSLRGEVLMKLDNHMRAVQWFLAALCIEPTFQGPLQAILDNHLLSASEEVSLLKMLTSALEVPTWTLQSSVFVPKLTAADTENLINFATFSKLSPRAHTTKELLERYAPVSPSTLSAAQGSIAESRILASYSVRLHPSYSLLSDTESTFASGPSISEPQVASASNLVPPRHNNHVPGALVVHMKPFDASWLLMVHLTRINRYSLVPSATERFLPFSTGIPATGEKDLSALSEVQDHVDRFMSLFRASSGLCSCGDADSTWRTAKSIGQSSSLIPVPFPLDRAPKASLYLGDSADILLARAEICLNQYDFLSALPYLRRIRAIDPLNIPATLVHLSTLLELKRVQEIFEITVLWSRIEPKHPITYYSIGVHHLALEKYPLALHCFIQCTQLDPTLAHVWVALGITCIHQSELKTAASAFRIAHRLQPHSHIPTLGLATVSAMGSNFSLAKTYLDIALNSNSYDPMLYHKAGVIEYQMGDYVAASRLFHFAISIVQESPIHLRRPFEATYFNLGHCYRKLGMYLDAIASYTEALLLQPSKSSTFAARGFAYHLAQSYTSAIHDYHSALDASPDDVFCNRLLNAALAHLVHGSKSLAPEEKSNHPHTQTQSLQYLLHGDSLPPNLASMLPQGIDPGTVDSLRFQSAAYTERLFHNPVFSQSLFRTSLFHTHRSGGSLGVSDLMDDTVPPHAATTTTADGTVESDGTTNPSQHLPTKPNPAAAAAETSPFAVPSTASPALNRSTTLFGMDSPAAPIPRVSESGAGALAEDLSLQATPLTSDQVHASEHLHRIRYPQAVQATPDMAFGNAPGIAPSTTASASATASAFPPPHTTTSAAAASSGTPSMPKNQGGSRAQLFQNLSLPEEWNVSDFGSLSSGVPPWSSDAPAATNAGDKAATSQGDTKHWKDGAPSPVQLDPFALSELLHSPILPIHPPTSSEHLHASYSTIRHEGRAVFGFDETQYASERHAPSKLPTETPISNERNTFATGGVSIDAYLDMHSPQSPIRPHSPSSPAAQRTWFSRSHTSHLPHALSPGAQDLTSPVRGFARRIPVQSPPRDGGNADEGAIASFATAGFSTAGAGAIPSESNIASASVTEEATHGRNEEFLARTVEHSFSRSKEFNISPIRVVHTTDVLEVSSTMFDTNAFRFQGQLQGSSGPSTNDPAHQSVSKALIPNHADPGKAGETPTQAEDEDLALALRLQAEEFELASQDHEMAQTDLALEVSRLGSEGDIIPFSVISSVGSFQPTRSFFGTESVASPPVFSPSTIDYAIESDSSEMDMNTSDNDVTR